MSSDLLDQIATLKLQLQSEGDSYALLITEISKLKDEIGRLKAGRFTDQEFQDLCHCFDETKECAFKRGCEEYQHRLFGRGAIEQERKRCELIVASQPINLSWVKDTIIVKIRSGE